MIPDYTSELNKIKQKIQTKQKKRSQNIKRESLIDWLCSLKEIGVDIALLCFCLIDRLTSCLIRLLVRPYIWMRLLIPIHSLVSYNRFKISISYLKKMIWSVIPWFSDHSKVSDHLNLIVNSLRYFSLNWMYKRWVFISSY